MVTVPFSTFCAGTTARERMYPSVRYLAVIASATLKISVSGTSFPISPA